MIKKSKTNLLPLATSVLAVALIAATSSQAQELNFARQPGPYYVGEPVMVQVVASGFKSTDKIDCQFGGKTGDGLSVDGPQVGQSSSSFTQIINGRVSRRESIDYRFSFVITSTREGEFDVGPFEVSTNGKTETVEGGKFRFGNLEPDPDMEIELSISRNAVFIGEKVPVSIRWAFGGDIEAAQYAFSNLQIRSPLFDQFSFQDKPRQSRTTLTLATAKGGVEVDAVVTQETKDGQQFIVVTGERTLIADSAGTFDSIPITCRTKKVTRWGRNLFGDRTAKNAAPALSVGKPVSLAVKSVPLSGRPKGFAGAVGQGFSVEVAANRSVVRVGDPISLTIKVQGDGNLEAISLPDLNSQMGLSEDDFQVSSEQLSGTLVGNSRQFSVNVRVKNQNIKQIPALSFCWFDPVSEKFATTLSKPIALQVMETKIVSALDVVANPGADPADVTQNASAKLAAKASSISFAGANLAIETNLDSLLANSNPSTTPDYLPAVFYVVSILLAGIVLLRSRRTEESVEKKRKKARLLHIRMTIQRAGSESGKEAYSNIADALRDFIREFEPAHRKNVEQIIAECDTATYSRSDIADKSRIKQITERALNAIDGGSTER